MLDVTSKGQEEALGVKFAEVSKKSELYRKNKESIEAISKPIPGSQDLQFATQYSQSFFTQCIACLWKQHWSCWRNTNYSAIRILFAIFTGLPFGTIFWNVGPVRGTKQNLFDSMGSMYAGRKSSWDVFSYSICNRTGSDRASIRFYSNNPLWRHSLCNARIRVDSCQVLLRIPVWWKWCYYTCPISWTLYGLLGSQFGDIEEKLETGETVAQFIKSYFE
ncbi:hypothetical protein ACET3Z_031584 [Daucus carota]